MRLTNAGPSIEWIIATASQRAVEQGPLIQEMRKIGDTYDSNLVIPMPEADRFDESPSPNIIAQGIDQMAGRISSTLPSIYFPPVRPGIKASEQMARTRIRATQGWLQVNRMNNRYRRRAFHQVAYGFSPYSVTYSTKWGFPQWVYRDPLNTFPAPTNDPDEMTPPDVIYKMSRTYGWLKHTYAAEMAGLNVGTDPQDGTLFDLIEYNDAEVTVLAIIGVPNSPFTPSTKKQFAELDRYPNKAGICLGVMAGRIGLSKRRGQFNNAIGLYKAQSRVDTLQMIAIERGIFPNTYLVGRPGEEPRFMSGPHDGRTGRVNIVEGGEPIVTMAQYSQGAAVMSNNLERSQRVTAGIAPEMGGESQSNVRTGKRGDAILSAVIDVPVQAAQEMLAESLHQEIIRAIAVDKSHNGSRARSFYVGNDKSRTTYVPAVAFENDNCTVTYAMAGADANGTAVALGQRLGLGMISKHTAMEIDTFVTDVELEIQRVETEGLEAALLSQIEQQAAAGSIPPGDIAAIITARMSGDTLAEAVIKVQAAAQQRQATLAAQPGPGQATAPEAQPGLAIPGQGAEQPTVAAPSQSQVNLSDLMRDVQHPAQMAAAASGRPELGG